MDSKLISLQEAAKLTGPKAFNLMVKPAGSLCNLACAYCYYLDKADIYGGHEPRMTLPMLEQFVRKYIEANDVEDVYFNWHGGEPFVLGLDFYKAAVEFEKKYAGGKRCHNTIQTNGTLLDYTWGRFLHDNDFLVGISLDGPEDIHNKYRKNRAGRGAWADVMRGVDILHRCNVEFNTMTTVNKASEGRGLEVYQFLKSIGSTYMQFMPVVEHLKGGAIADPSQPDSTLAPWSVSARAYGKFLCDIFDYWVCHDVGRYYVLTFDAALANWVGAMPCSCVWAETCGGNYTLEHNGDVYPCDHFVYPQYRLGNILEDSLESLLDLPATVRFGTDKRNTLPNSCLKCKWYFACHGECPKHRFNSTDRGTTGVNALCEGYKMFYSHIAPAMDYMKDCLSKNIAPASIMPLAQMGRF